MESFSKWLVTGPNKMKKISSYGYISRINLIERVLKINIEQLSIKEIEKLVADGITPNEFLNKSPKQLTDLRGALRKYALYKKSSKN
jgi:hypothetical protein